MSFQKVIIMGTFRTGSTFLAKALSAHRNMTVPSDPYFYFFKALRNELFIREGVQGFDCDCPVSDNFFSEYAAVNRKIRQYDLNIPITHNTLDQILENISNLARRDAERLDPFLKEISGVETYKDLFEALINAVHRAYGDEHTTHCGFKVTFVEQFLDVLLNTYPDLKCVYLMRDPRAILASQNVFYQRAENKSEFKGRGIYPFLYVIRHWRKSVAYFLDNRHKTENVCLMRYEDLMSEPRKNFNLLCDFLGVEYDPGMCDPTSYKDGAGVLWTQNSSYGTSTEITTRYMDKWKDVLTKEHVQLLEDLCTPEMEGLGYERVTQDNPIESLIQAQSQDMGQIDPWIMKYLESYQWDRKQIERELLRRSLENVSWDTSPAVNSFFEEVYIGKNYFAELEAFRLNKFIPAGPRDSVR